MRNLLVISSLAFIFTSAPEYVSAAKCHWNPPKRFDRPYKGKLTVLRVDPTKIAATCGIPPDNGATKACALTPHGEQLRDGSYPWCIVVIPNRGDCPTPAAALRHEIGHCNGWPGHHPK